MAAVIAVGTDNGYIITAAFGAIAVLFGALGKIALELLKRTDAAHAREIALYQLWLEEERKRGDEWRQLAHAERDVTSEAVSVAAKKV